MTSLPETETAPPAMPTVDGTKQRLLRAIDTFEASKSSREIMLEADAAAMINTDALVGRSVRVYWPDDDAWYLGLVTSYDPGTGQHAVDYADGSHEHITAALDRIRLMLTVGADLPVASPSALAAYCAVLESRADRTQAKEPEEAATIRRKVAELKTLMPPPVVVPAPTQEEEEEEGAEEHKRPPFALPGDYRPGDLVWAQVKGFPPWPAMVVTMEHGYDGKRNASKKSRQNYVPVIYFGTFERSWQKLSSLTPMREGIEKNLHIAKTNRRRQFAAAICEVCEFMTNGELPEGIFPCNDEPDSDEEDEEEEESEKKGGKNAEERPAKRPKQKESSGMVWSSISREPGMPLQVGKSLKVLSLGRIEWLHPAFHDEKCIWPVGFRAEKVATTPAGGEKPVRHLCEVLAAPDGSGPIFRYSGNV